mmetsp:Transcript_42531/g.70723  ORF Transcript_42531/g.70723 Transcript_42531/m.70723 type:complete len:995 (+) Transcript_42531:123-3107(+)|eukprot:CAMPEP_0119337212 /NCGR_PEP_ID=MMETSP1333-20130426/93510_1 /TAXON_ID=418940 /ORGANISM="Scyphosphaera apsteinii, Strain RCC1455" /LENGTH=994 /DNA_ID=CAMNT_0007348209 /DNA_START=120 /DNA_END=3104 /DNA_ORIENTATION=+
MAAPGSSTGPPPPKAVRLEALEIEGNVADCIGLYRLVDHKLVNGKPAWRHTRLLDKWLAWNGTTAWNVQSESNLGKTKGWLQLLDKNCLYPSDSRVTWEAWDGSDWLKQPRLTCTSAKLEELPAPTALLVDSPKIESEANGCLGLYALVQGRIVNGKPVWRHTGRPNRWLSFNGDNAWNAQSEANLGKSRGWLQLLDKNCHTPDLSSVVWDAADGKGGWMKVPKLTVRVSDPKDLPPPIAIRLECNSGISGTAANFLGLYKLVMDKRVNGRPCYRHAQSAGRWIAYNGDNAWNAQSEASLGQKRGWLQLLDSGAATPDMSKITWDSADGNGKWSKRPGLKCYAVDSTELPPPKAIILGGEPVTGTAANYLGLFRLEEGKLINGRPCYRHVERPTQFIAYNGTSAWNAQSEQSLGQSRGWMQLLDTSCHTPDVSLLSWETADGQGKWDRKPNLKCREADPKTMPPSAALHLTGATESNAEECLGLYRLIKGYEVNGRPCWRSTRRSDRWIAFNGENAWNAQSEASLGRKRGWLQLLDNGVSAPEFSKLAWEAWDGNGWVKQAECTCVSVDPSQLPPPPMIELAGPSICGNAGACLGTYKLSSRQINGRAAFQKTEREDRWLAWNGDNAWNAQSAASLGEKKGWIQLLDGVPTPDQTSVIWEAWIDNKWQQQPLLKCTSAHDPPLPQCDFLKRSTAAALVAQVQELPSPAKPMSKAKDDEHKVKESIKGSTSAAGQAASNRIEDREDNDPQLSSAGVRMNRLQPELESSISAVPTLKLSKPEESCRECLFKTRDLVPDIDTLLEDVAFKVEQLKWEDLPATLDDDELFAIAAYTFDFNTGDRAGNLYYELNQSLRRRDAKSRGVMLAIWGGYLYYFMAALEKLPSLKMHVYRGYPDKQTVVQQYKEGRPVQWGAFSSTSRRVEPASAFTSKEDGVIFKLKVHTGKDIKDFSFFAAEEQEVILSPQTRFVVISEPYEGEDGYTYLDLLEQSGTMFLS